MPTGTLWVHINTTHGRWGHCWIEFLETGTNVKESWGTFGTDISELEGLMGVEQFGGLKKDREVHMYLDPTEGASREAILDNDAYNRLQGVINKYTNMRFAWSLWNTCAAFASDVWKEVTGEDLFGMILPGTVADAVNDLNNPPTRERR